MQAMINKLLHELFCNYYVVHKLFYELVYTITQYSQSSYTYITMFMNITIHRYIHTYIVAYVHIRQTTRTCVTSIKCSYLCTMFYMLTLQLYFYRYPESKQSTDTPVVNIKIFDGAAVASSNA